MGFSRQEYCSGLPCPSPGDLPDPGIICGSPALQADSLPSEPLAKFLIHERIVPLFLLAKPALSYLYCDLFFFLAFRQEKGVRWLERNFWLDRQKHLYHLQRSWNLLPFTKRKPRLLMLLLLLRIPHPKSNNSTPPNQGPDFDTA